jgi:hypothetical protein
MEVETTHTHTHTFKHTISSKTQSWILQEMEHGVYMQQIINWNKGNTSDLS